jgi:hypothetical protein
MIVFKEIKIKYEYLDNILEEKLNNIKFSNNVNIIVDLKEIIRKVYRPDILDEENISRDNIEDLASDIIGIAAHYRNYFYKKGKYTSLYFMYSETECTLMKEKFPEYKKEHYEKYFYDPKRINRHAMVKKAINIAKKVLNRVPNCQFIDTNEFDEFVSIKFLVQKVPSNEIAIILSNDEIMAQLINNHTFMLNIKSINSDLLDEKNAVSKLFKRSTILSSKLISLISAILGTQRYSLNTIDNVGPYRAIKAVEHLVESGKILDTEYVNFPIKKENLNKKNTYEKLILEHYDAIKENFELIRADDVLYSNQTNIMVKFNKPKQTYSVNHFLELNAKIFTVYPISIDMLLKGEA